MTRLERSLSVYFPLKSPIHPFVPALSQYRHRRRCVVSTSLLSRKIPLSTSCAVSGIELRRGARIHTPGEKLVLARLHELYILECRALESGVEERLEMDTGCERHS